MAVSIKEFQKSKNFLLCVDSYGCAMDTMNVKHFRCFGPCFADEWSIVNGREEVLGRWNEINLFEITRGINRFKGLAMILSELYPQDENVLAFRQWTMQAKELSEKSISDMVVTNPVFEKALRWSQAVNRCIAELPDTDKTAFSGVKKALRKAGKYFDIAVVSSANYSAVIEEWSRCGLLDCIDIVTTQQDGSKAHCISELLKKGYDATHVLMCGDAPGDLEAAAANSVSFYPILVGKEADSWAHLPDFLQLFVCGDSTEEELRLKRAFYSNLNA